MAHIVIMNAGIGGMTGTYEMRELLSVEHKGIAFIPQAVTTLDA